MIESYKQIEKTITLIVNKDKNFIKGWNKRMKKVSKAIKKATK